ncbi:MAG: mannose-1-phosphate guanylyltransferase, partial [Prevotellaceae bacterium]|nr:mannose-1-phosphate guanylyltransferase [Prevotellaceae bacterium]
QFLDILGVGKSFLQQTFDRFASVIPRENIFIVTGTTYVSIINEQIPGLTPYQIIAEPDRRNTAPCIAYATYKILEKTPEATIIVTPSDALILNEVEFLRVIQQAMDFASSGNSLVTIGIKPTRPETGYGYIQMNMPATVAEGKPFKVKTFTEKPPLELAKVFVESGEFFWNSGIFAWSLSAIRQALQTLLPEVDGLFQKGAGIYNTPEEAPFIRKVYAECRNVSIDYGIMEKAENVYAFPGDFGWSDLGTWESLYLQREKDAQGNLIDAPQVSLHKVSNSTITVSDKHKLAVIEGLNHYLVVDTDDVLLICPRNNEEGLKQIMKKVDPKYL